MCGVSSVGVGGPALAIRSKAAQADSEYEVHWPHVIRAARVPKVDPTTASKNMRAAVYDVKWRAPRLKPARGEADEKERKRVCNVLRKLPVRYWLEGVDVDLDNRQWDVPSSVKGRKFLKMRRVRCHLRAPGEGLKRGLTEPHPPQETSHEHRWFCEAVRWYHRW